MRLISQSRLHYQGGNSDKVYEVDLCEAGEGEFIVNFRYGRMGNRLQEGTKTPFPVDQERAQKIYDELIASKLKKGYQDSASSRSDYETEEKPASLVETPGGALDSPQARAIVRYLKAAIDGNPSKTWKLSRILWRAGEIGAPEFTPLLLKVPVKTDMEQYSLVRALGKTGDVEVVTRLKEYAQSQDEKVSRIAIEGLLNCLPEKEKSEYTKQLRASLPDSIQDALQDSKTTAESLTGIVELLLQNEKPPHDYFYTLYTQANEYPIAREAVYNVLRTRPFEAPWFRAFRRVFKAAEFRLDSEIYGLMAWRFEKSDGSFDAPWGYIYHTDQVTGSHEQIRLEQEYKKPDCRYGYSKATRQYMRRRICRTLLRHGELNDAESFITLATGVLMAYDDAEDKGTSYSESVWSWDDETQSAVSSENYFGPYASLLPLNFLLFENGSRYTFVKANKIWKSLDGHQPDDEVGQQLPDQREEAFPHLWDAAPDALEHLLRHSKCGAVHEFAAKAWRDNSSFNERADNSFVVDLVNQAYQVTQELAIDLAKSMFDPSNPARDLVLALLGCDLETARELALGWVRECKKHFESDASFLARAILIGFDDVHSALRAWIGTNRPAKDLLTKIIPEVVEGLLKIDPKSDSNSSDISRNIRETLLMVGGDRLGDMSHQMVRELLSHAEGEIQLLGAQVLNLATEPPETIPDELWELMLNSLSPSVREIGMDLFGRLGDEALEQRSEILASFCLSENDDIRRAARPIVERLAATNSGFGQDMVLQFYPITLRKEEIEGLHDDVYELLAGPLNEHLHAIPADSCFKMIESRYAAGQRLGLLVLQKYINLDEVPMLQLAKLGGQDNVDGREYIWKYYCENNSRTKQELADALRILDTDWDDAREFGFAYFRDHFDESDWTPEVLISLCDSVRGDIQDYGREMITRFFKQENGQEYLTKLSQHPTTELQTFATNYLERFATGDVGKIAELEPYFITVLSQINRGRVAKQRVMNFLEKEASENREIAELVIPILSRISATITIVDKAACIRTMRNLSERWKGIETPLTRIKPPIHHS